MIMTLVIGLGGIAALAGGVTIFDHVRLPHWRATARERRDVTRSAV